MESDCTIQNIDKLINVSSEKIAKKIKNWHEAGVCYACIERRIHLHETWLDSYNNFDHAHDPCFCTCI